MIRRVSSRQRLVSWDSFDATSQIHHSDDGESSYGDAHSSLFLDVDDHNDERHDDNDEDQKTNAHEVDKASTNVPSSSSLPVSSLVSAASLIPFKRKRAAPRHGTSTTSTLPPSTASSQPTTSVVPIPYRASEIGVAVAVASISNKEYHEDPSPFLLADDALGQVCSYLDLRDLRSLCQVNHRLRTLLLGQGSVQSLENSCSYDSDYVWKQQAQRFWNLPIENWVLEGAFSGNGNGRFSNLQHSTPSKASHTSAGSGSQHSVSTRLRLLALAQPVPTEIDASIFTPCRWARHPITLHPHHHHHPLHPPRMIRSSLHKELEVVHVHFKNNDGEGKDTTAIHFLGVVGQGDRSIRANVPLPRPAKKLPTRRYWRNPFRRMSSSSSSSSSESSFAGLSTSPLSLASSSSALLSSSSSSSLKCKWQPFVVPTLVHNNDAAGGSVWNVSPRLVSYFEVEILPSNGVETSSTTSSNSSSAAHMAGHHHHHNVPLLRHHHAKDCVAVGLATNDFMLHGKMPGWDQHSWGYHGDDAGLFHGAGTSTLNRYGPKFGCGDTVGCGVDYIQEQIFYTLNGRFLGYAFSLADRDNSISKILYPVVGVDTTSLVRVNFHGPFCFDLHQMLKDQEPTVLAALHQMEK